MFWKSAYIVSLTIWHTQTYTHLSIYIQRNLFTSLWHPKILYIGYLYILNNKFHGDSPCCTKYITVYPLDKQAHMYYMDALSSAFIIKKTTVYISKSLWHKLSCPFSKTFPSGVFLLPSYSVYDTHTHLLVLNLLTHPDTTSIFLWIVPGIIHSQWVLNWHKQALLKEYCANCEFR